MNPPEVTLQNYLEITADEHNGQFSVVPDERHQSFHKVVHQAVLAALAEGAAWKKLNDIMAIPTSFSCSFVKPAKLGSTVWAKPSIVNRSKRLALVAVEVTQHSELIVVYHIHFFFMEPRPAKP